MQSEGSTWMSSHPQKSERNSTKLLLEKNLHKNRVPIHKHHLFIKFVRYQLDVIPTLRQRAQQVLNHSQLSQKSAG